MKSRNAFAGCHPLVNFLFYVFAILYSVFLSHPYYILISLLASLIFASMLDGRGTLKLLLFLLPLMALIALLNPVFNHHGTVPPLFYLGDNPVTVEALLYGCVAAATVAAVLLWFASYNRVVTSDKFLYLFGRIIPKLALILSMALRLIPKMRDQIRVIANAQNMIGRGLKGRGLLGKIKSGLRILSVLVTWSMENGIETADSMKARGYGTGRRTSFTLYRFYRRDAVLLSTFLILAAVAIAGMATGTTFFSYRILSFPALTIWQTVSLVSFAAACAVPLFVEIQERLSWRCSLSKI